MADFEDQQDREGIIRSHVEFAEAAANGSRAMAEFLLENGAHIDAPGRGLSSNTVQLYSSLRLTPTLFSVTGLCLDGTTPICAAALWGNDSMVSFLLDKGADIQAKNEGTGWTALHAAAFQEHGKAVRVLLDRGANPKSADSEGRTPIDYASISEAIWPFFAARGCRRSQKSELITKGIIRKIAQDQPEHTPSGDKYSDSLSSFSRPGSSYTRAQFQPPVGKRQGTVKSRDGRAVEPIDPLGDAPVQRPSNQRRPSFQGLAL